MTLPYLLVRYYKSLLILLLSFFVTGIGLKAQTSKTIYSIPLDGTSTTDIGKDDVYFLHWNLERTIVALAYYKAGMNEAQLVDEYRFKSKSVYNRVHFARIRDTLYLLRNTAHDSSMIIDIVYEGKRYGQIGERGIAESHFIPGRNSLYYTARKSGDEISSVYQFNLKTRRKTLLLKGQSSNLYNYQNLRDTLVFAREGRLLACSKPNDTALLAKYVYTYIAGKDRIYYLKHDGDYNYHLGACNLNGKHKILKYGIRVPNSGFHIINGKLTFWENRGDGDAIHLVNEAELTVNKITTTGESYYKCSFIGDNYFVINGHLKGFTLYDLKNDRSYKLGQTVLFRNEQYKVSPVDVYQNGYQPCLYYMLLSQNPTPGDSQYFFRLCPWDTGYTPAFKGRAIDTIPSFGQLVSIHLLGNDLLHEYWQSSKRIVRIVGDIRNNVEPVEVSRFEIYPNPTSSLVWLRLSDQQEPSHVRVYNSMGHELRGVYHSTTKTIDLGNAAPGWYLVRLSTNSGTLNRIIIRQ